MQLLRSMANVIEMITTAVDITAAAKAVAAFAGVVRKNAKYL
jgi:hypothetical protein